MESNIFSKKNLRIGLLCILYMVVTFCALAIRRYHQTAFFVEKPNPYFPTISHPWIYYALFAILSVAFLVLLFRKGLDSALRKAFLIVFSATEVCILIIYKLVMRQGDLAYAFLEVFDGTPLFYVVLFFLCPFIFFF